MVEQQTINTSASIAAISWTGGKDCNLALLHAWRDPTLHVKYLVVFRTNKSFHAHPLPFIEAQASSLGLQLIYVDFDPPTTDWMEAYITRISSLHDTYNIQTITTGDINLVGTLERNWMERACQGAGIRCHLPLWDIDKEKTLNVMLEEGLDIIFTCVKAPFFDASWINRTLDRVALDEMKEMIRKGLTKEQMDAGVKELDLCGEMGRISYHVCGWTIV
jgi:uncharacterized protein (TIGR00290 family)